MKWILLLLPSFLASCALQKTPEVVAGEVRSTSSVWINGAEVRSDVEAMKGRGALQASHLIFSAGTNKLDGPFYWEFVAEGSAGEHVSMTVEAVQIMTQRTRRKVNFPAEMLGGANAFAFEEVEKPKRSLFGKREKEEAEPAKEPKWFASYRLPSSLQLYPKVDGKVTLAAKITIESTTGSASEWVNFALLPPSNTMESYQLRQAMIEYGGVPID